MYLGPKRAIIQFISLITVIYQHPINNLLIIRARHFRNKCHRGISGDLIKKKYLSIKIHILKEILKKTSFANLVPKSKTISTILTVLTIFRLMGEKI